MMDIKKKLRKKLGFYYRFIKQYHKNKSVFNQLIDLQQYPLSYYSHLQQQSIFEGDVISAVERGDVIIIKDLIGQLQLGDKFQALSKQFFDLDVDQLGDIHTLKNVEQIVDIIQKYSSKKANGCDEVSVAMLQLCASEVAIPLTLIFQKCITSGTFPNSWKSANVQPIHKKNDRQLKSNYRPISLLPICGKILEK